MFEIWVGVGVAHTGIMVWYNVSYGLLQLTWCQVWLR